PDELINFTLPFPPNISPREIMTSTSKRKSKKKTLGKKATKPPNAFMIYRKVFCREIAKSHRFQQMKISTICSKSWKSEPVHVKDFYNDLAAKVDILFLESRDREEQQGSQDSSLQAPPHLENQGPTVDYFLDEFDTIESREMLNPQYNYNVAIYD